MTPDVRRVLIYRLGSLGDTVVALPSLHLIERTYPNAERMLLTNIPVHAKAPAASAVLGASGLIHRYLSYPVGTRNPLRLARLWWKIRQFRPDVLIYLMGIRPQSAMRRDAKFFRACGIAKMVGVPWPAQDLATLQYDAENDLYEAEAHRLARSLAALGSIDLHEPANWDLRLTSAERATAEKMLEPLNGKPFICMGIGCKKQPSEWGAENWTALSAALWPHFRDYALVLVGASEDRENSHRVASAWQGTSLNLCGHLSPRETAAVMASAELFVGPDSGPGHLAAAVGTPCASVFAAISQPGKWYPFGSANQVVYHKTDCSNCETEMCIEQKKKCILSITVDEVAAAAFRSWELGQARRPQALASQRG